MQHCILFSNDSFYTVLSAEEHPRYDPSKSNTSKTDGSVECNYRNMGDIDCEQISDTVCVRHPLNMSNL